jgi:hypothetical protein
VVLCRVPSTAASQRMHTTAPCVLDDSTWERPCVRVQNSVRWLPGVFEDTEDGAECVRARR